MMRTIVAFLVMSFFCMAFSSVQAADLRTKLEELTAPEFIEAVEKSGGTCILPFGILEKHGPHLPLGTDTMDAREIALRAASQEYALVFPPYYFGQIFEAKHQPGTFAYSSKVVWDLLQETCDELSRNGINKIIIVNGHGGNTSFLQFFIQSQLARRKDYAVVLFQPSQDQQLNQEISRLSTTPFDYHGGEQETSTMMAHRPDIVHADRAASQSGEDQKRLENLPHSYTGIWWYARFPNHYAGDGTNAKAELGELIINSRVRQLVELLRVMKADNRILELQNRFFDESEAPLKTQQ
jgi:creatinine amidohydrolase